MSARRHRGQFPRCPYAPVARGENHLSHRGARRRITRARGAIRSFKVRRTRIAMTLATSTRLATSCPECGAAVPGREACQRLFDEVLAREFGDYRYARMHRLIVDIYSLQHPAEYMRSAKSYAAHLTGMYAALEECGAAETNRTVQQWLNGPKAFPRPDDPAPRQRGVLTILHVHGAIDPKTTFAGFASGRFPPGRRGVATVTWRNSGLKRQLRLDGRSNTEITPIIPTANDRLSRTAVRSIAVVSPRTAGRIDHPTRTTRHPARPPERSHRPLAFV